MTDSRVDSIRRLCGRLAQRQPLVQIMEICGTHTMAIARGGLRGMFPASLRLVNGPGCPVCVTDQAYIDQAVYLALGRSGDKPIVATYGDMLRVPGRLGSLGEARGQGAQVEIVYSAENAVDIARKNPARQVVFLGVGFETTAPGTALAVKTARAADVKNFSVLLAHKTVLPAMRALLAADDVRIDGFLCPGHVSVILGWRAYEPIAREYHRPCVVAGFDPDQVLMGIEAILTQLADGQARAGSVYPSVSADGNAVARRLLEEVFAPCDAPWRAIGVIPGSGLAFREEWSSFDAATRFDLPAMESYERPGCRCGDVICGRVLPRQCGLFGRQCTPRTPVGPCMVSSEGACAAAFKYER
ncbi:MAG: hydrogenase formation protein HypD [Planctomycetota bacterium]|nr:hydrogenase formation protein HypD [Planctomycetota bacterium]